MQLTDYYAKYFAYELAKRCPSDSMEKLAGAVAGHCQQLSDEVGADRYPNLTVKKIPTQVLSRCEWGHDDYSLQVENLPKAPPKPGQAKLFEPEGGDA